MGYMPRPTWAPSQRPYAVRPDPRRVALVASVDRHGLRRTRHHHHPIALPSRRQAAHPEPLPVEPLRDGSHQT